jgi:uncharacterized protein YbjT (DUF2867 family)
VRVFVSGATGTVGREVCRALASRDVEVRVGARASSDVGTVVPEVQDVVPFDYELPIDPAVFTDVDAFFFMTPLIEDQVAGSHAALTAAVETGVQHVVRLSSRSAGWDMSSLLRAWHREVDQQVMDSSPSWTVLRPCSFFQNFIKHQGTTIRDMSSIILPQGNGLIPYVDAADLGDAAAACLLDRDSHAGHTYVLTGGRAYGGKGVAAEIGRVLGRPITYIHIEPEQSEAMMQDLEMPSWLVEAAMAVFAHARDGGEAEVDPSLAQILGRPATTLSEFVDRNRDAWR